MTTPASSAAPTPRAAQVEPLREALADLCHRQWSGWMEYLFSQSTDMGGSVRIPEWAVERWQRQMATPYAELSEQEKDSDRAEADKFLALLAAPQPQPPASACSDCGKPYPFGLDTTLPNLQWVLIMGEPDSRDDPGGLLCANCIVTRAARLPGAIAARMVIEICPPAAGGGEGK